MIKNFIGVANSSVSNLSTTYTTIINYPNAVSMLYSPCCVYGPKPQYRSALIGKLSICYCLSILYSSRASCVPQQINLEQLSKMIRTVRSTKILLPCRQCATIQIIACCVWDAIAWRYHGVLNVHNEAGIHPSILALGIVPSISTTSYQSA